jgi:BNR repeat-like domain
MTVMLAVAIFLSHSTSAGAQTFLVKVSQDNFSNSGSQHRTEVEPDTYSWGSTIVGAFQVARNPYWGGADIGFSTSQDGGKTWTYGYLPGLTVNYQGGAYYAASDASVSYDAKHDAWLILSLPLIDPIGDIAVSRSTDGGLTWGNPVVIDSTHNDDKGWIACDNSISSPYYGHCYAAWDAAASTGQMKMSTSSDGGLTWGPALSTADHATGLGGQPLVQPNGTVIVPFTNGGMYAYISTDGGASWSTTYTISSYVPYHGTAGGFRTFLLPSAEIDPAGNVYVAWMDCRFRSGCTSNDIVMSTSSDGKAWSSPSRIPIDPVTSTVDHFIPGLGVDHATSGPSAHLALVYYFFPVANCNSSSCQLYVGHLDSTDGGNTWTAARSLAGPMHLSWLPDSDLGKMVADYISTSFVNGEAYSVFAVANPLYTALYNEAMYTTPRPLSASPDGPRFSSKNDQPIPGVRSDHEPRICYDDECRYPVPLEKQYHPGDLH